MNRREFCSGAATSVIALALGFCGGAHAGDANSIETLSDGYLELPLNFVLPDGVPGSLSSPALKNAAGSGTLMAPCNVTILRRPQGLVLFDCGAGPNFTNSTGALSQSLSAAGIDTSDVSDVIFTHAHPDHLWGAVDDFGDLMFPEATYHVCETEWDYWRSARALEEAPDDRKGFVVGAVNRFEAIEARLKRFRPGNEVLQGIEAVAAVGHTPGHCAFVVDADERTMVVGDALSNDPVSFLRPDLQWGPDQDRETAAGTRMRLLDRLAAEKLLMIGYHLPNGGRGRVEKSGAGYRFVRAT